MIEKISREHTRLAIAIGVLPAIERVIAKMVLERIKEHLGKLIDRDFRF